MKYVCLIVALLCICVISNAQPTTHYRPHLRITEEDGSPDGRPRQLYFDNNTLVDNADGSFTVYPASGSGAIASFVPYIGANANVDIGTYDFTTTGTLDSGLLTVTYGGDTGILVKDSSAQAAAVGGGVDFWYKWTDAGAFTNGGGIRLEKTNSTTGDYSTNIIIRNRLFGKSTNTSLKIMNTGALVATSPINTVVGANAGLDVRMKYNPESNDAANNTTGAFTTAEVAGANEALNILGLQAHALYSGTGRPTSVLSGFNALCTIRSGAAAGTVIEMRAGQYSINNSDADTVVTNVYGLRVKTPTNAGTFTDTYGFHVESQTVGTQTNNPFGVYQAGTADFNYFAGNTGFGKTAPLSPVQIQKDLGAPSDLGDFSEYQLVIGTGTATGKTAGILLHSTQDTYGGSAIVHYDTGGGGKGDLVIYTKQSTSAIPPVEVIRFDDAGNVGINEPAPQDTLEVNGTGLFKDKLKFTQDDGNEFIDSLNDGFMDYGATTAHRFLNDVTVTGTTTTNGFVASSNFVTIDYTIASNDYVVLASASTAITMFLNPAATNTGRIYHVKNIGSSASSVIINPNASELIDDDETLTLSTRLQAVSIQSDGTQWWIF